MWDMRTYTGIFYGAVVLVLPAGWRRVECGRHEHKQVTLAIPIVQREVAQGPA